VKDRDVKDRGARAASFGNTAELYEFGRPGYPPDLIESLFGEIGIDRPRILDLGAGTGKLTRQLVPYGSVIAVEPLDEMRAQLHLVLPDVDCRPGNAESIPLPDASVDIVMVGQAYHWFDQERANPEIARVLVEGGHLIALWSDEVRIPWIERLTVIMSDGDAGAWERTDEWWTKQFQNDPWFTQPVRREGTMTVVTSKRALLARMESHSFLSVKSPAERAPVLDEIAELIADFTDPFDVDYATEAYWCRKLPLSAS
jgi:SAM-dependent methyltransferase